MKIKTEIRVTPLQAKKTASKSLGARQEAWNRFSTTPSEESNPGHLDLGPLVFRTVKKHIFAV